MALLAVVVWGASFVATRIALQWLNPVALITVRVCVGSLMLAAILRMRRQTIWPGRSEFVLCGILGAVLGGHILIQAVGLQFTTATNTGWIIGFMPVTIALGAQMLGRQRLSLVGWGGVMLGTFGVLLVTMPKLQAFADARFGDILQVTSCLTWTAYTLVAIGPVSRMGSLRVTASTMTIAAIMMLPLCGVAGRFMAPMTPPALTAVLFLSVFCSGLAYLWWVTAVNDHGPTRVGAMLYLEPFVTLAVAAALLDEPVSWHTLAGGLCVLAGVAFVSRGSR